ncbi:MAG: phage tail assembly chaperone [Pseudomonadota bacterium]
MSGFDWDGLLKAGVRHAGLKPAELWALTPYELALILGTDEAQAPLTRAGLMKLDALYGGNGERDD